MNELVQLFPPLFFRHDFVENVFGLQSQPEFCKAFFFCLFIADVEDALLVDRIRISLQV